MDWYEQALIMYPWLRTIGLPILPTLLGFAVGAVTTSPIPFLLGIGGTAGYLVAFMEQIKPEKGQDGEESPQFGLIEIFGRRLPIVLDEGLTIRYPGSRIVRRSKELINRDISVSGVRCRLKHYERKDGDGNVVKFSTLWEALQKSISSSSGPDVDSGGSVIFNIGLTMERDYTDGWKVIDYDTAGETPQVLKILTDRISDTLREVGRRLTWLQATFATDIISAYVITALTGDKAFDGVKDIISDGTNEQIENFLNDVKINGRSYVGGLGIKIRRLQVTNVIPEGKLAQEAENAAVEELRRVGMLENARAISETFRIYREKLTDGSVTDREVLTAVQVNDPDARVNHEIKTLNVPDADKLAQAIVRILRGLGAK